MLTNLTQLTTALTGAMQELETEIENTNDYESRLNAFHNVEDQVEALSDFSNSIQDIASQFSAQIIDTLFQTGDDNE